MITTVKPCRTAAALFLAAGTVFAANAASAADFSGKTVTILTPFKEGGGADTTARLFAPYLKQYLPGNPNVIVLNMPGGASVKGCNYFEQNAKPDGLMSVIASTSNQMNFAIRHKTVKYNVLTWRPVFVVAQDTVYSVRPETGVKGKNILEDIQALQKAKLVGGAKKPTGGETRSIMTFDLLGINMKTVFGLSAGKQRQAFARGELNVNYDSASAFNKKGRKLVDQGKVIALMTLGIPQPDGSFTKSADFAHLPTALEIYEKMHGKKPSGLKFEVWKSFVSMGVATSKGMALPKGTPDEILNTWITAVKKIQKDKKFAKQGRKILGNYPIHTGEDARKLLKLSVDISEEGLAWYKSWVKKQFNTGL